MYIASKKRKENIAEYLLYMWQIEDMIRANGLDIDRIKHNIIDRMELTEAQRKELTEWYESLIDMMHREEVTQKGHLQMNRNVLASIAELHRALLEDPRFEDYTKAFYKALPVIVDLRSKAGEEKAGEIETCFNALYGMLMLRLQGKEITPATLDAMNAISNFIAMLSAYYIKNEKEDIFLDDKEKE